VADASLSAVPHVDRPLLALRAGRSLSASPRPFLRWAGSKRALLDHIVSVLPDRFDRYIEPFAGSAALFFLLQPPAAVLSDANSDLVETYLCVRQDWQRVADEYRRYDVLDSDMYYRVRADVPSDPMQRAGRLIYLNRACWNGLYRVNSKGLFNVPYGAPRSASPIDEGNLRACASALGAAEIATNDFETTLSEATSGDLVYLDPPYVTTHNLNGFRDYNQKLFSWEDQIRLAQISRVLADEGCHVVISNADHESVLALYPGFRVLHVERNSTLASNATRRMRVGEVLIWNG